MGFKVGLSLLLITALVFCGGCSSFGSDSGWKTISQVSKPLETKYENKESTDMDKSGNALPRSRVEKITLHSKALKKDMKVNVYLPKGYSKNAKYPVWYAIHGYTGNEDSWINDQNIGLKADELLDQNKINPVIIVSPQIDNSYGINSSKETKMLFVDPNAGKDPKYAFFIGMYEDYLCKELIPYIDANYSTVASGEGRYIGGISMGGFVALHLAFYYEGMFSKVGGHSPAVWTDSNLPGDLGKGLYPDDTARRQRDPLYLAKNKALQGLSVYLDCGDKDSFSEGCNELYKVLKEKGVKAELHIDPGEHNNTYWKAQAENYILFYASKDIKKE